MQLREYLKTNRLITDGAMGTYFEEKYKEHGKLAESFCLSEPEKVKQIHSEYIKSGARLIRTNTFAANTMFFEAEEVKKIIRAGYKIAAEAAAEANEEVFVAADLGQIVHTDLAEEDTVLKEYFEICDTFLECGAQNFVLETQSEFRYAKEVVSYLKEKKKDCFVIVQFAVDKSGYTRSGVSVERIVAEASQIKEFDAFGFNCGVGAAHLYRLLEKITFPEGKYITALPNAGYPVELRGKTIYTDNRRYFVEMMKKIAELGIEVLGGCCGTTPSYIAELNEAVQASNECQKKKRTAKLTVCEKESEKEYRLNVAEKLKNGEKVYIVELDPPFDLNISKVMNGAKQLKAAGVDLITLADSPMARTRMDAGKLAAKVQRETDVSVMPHICCRDKNSIAMRSGILGDYMNELRHFLIVTGDPVGREDRGHVTPVFDFHSIRFMQYVTQMNEELFSEEPVLLAGALNYHGANPDAIIRRMEQKMKAGCQMFLSQPIYSDEDMERISYIKSKIPAKIICGILPLVSYKNAMFMANEMTGIRVPKEIIARYGADMTREEAEQTGIAIARELAEKMSDLADGYYFMTPFNRASMIAEILTSLKEQ